MSSRYFCCAAAAARKGFPAKVQPLACGEFEVPAKQRGLAEDQASDLIGPGEVTPVRAPQEAYPRTALFFSIATSTSSEGDVYLPLADAPTRRFWKRS